MKSKATLGEDSTYAVKYLLASSARLTILTDADI